MAKARILARIGLPASLIGAVFCLAAPYLLAAETRVHPPFEFTVPMLLILTFIAQIHNGAAYAATWALFRNNAIVKSLLTVFTLGSGFIVLFLMMAFGIMPLVSDLDEAIKLWISWAVFLLGTPYLLGIAYGCWKTILDPFNWAYAKERPRPRKIK